MSCVWDLLNVWGAEHLTSDDCTTPEDWKHTESHPRQWPLQKSCRRFESALLLISSFLNMSINGALIFNPALWLFLHRIAIESSLFSYYLYLYAIIQNFLDLAIPASVCLSLRESRSLLLQWNLYSLPNIQKKYNFVWRKRWRIQMGSQFLACVLLGQGCQKLRQMD